MSPQTHTTVAPLLLGHWFFYDTPDLDRHTQCPRVAVHLQLCSLSSGVQMPVFPCSLQQCEGNAGGAEAHVCWPDRDRKRPSWKRDRWAAKRLSCGWSGWCGSWWRTEDAAKWVLTQPKYPQAAQQCRCERILPPPSQPLYDPFGDVEAQVVPAAFMFILIYCVLVSVSLLETVAEFGLFSLISYVEYNGRYYTMLYFCICLNESYIHNEWFFLIV